MYVTQDFIFWLFMLWLFMLWFTKEIMKEIYWLIFKKKRGDNSERCKNCSLSE